MLNFYNSSIIDRNLLEESFNAIQQRNPVEIITGEEKEKLYQQTISAIRTPNETKNFSFENLFKIKCSAGNFYIAQCAIDFGYPPSQMGYPTSTPQHILQLIGIAKSNIDLGNTFIRPETKVDKFLSHFMNHDVIFNQSEQFSERYYISSDKKDIIRQTFDPLFLDGISTCNDLLLATKGTEMYISFSSALSAEQGIMITDVFSKCTFLSKV